VKRLTEAAEWHIMLEAVGMLSYKYMVWLITSQMSEAIRLAKTLFGATCTSVMFG
jgi:hypothetical protein